MALPDNVWWWCHARLLVDSFEGTSAASICCRRMPAIIPKARGHICVRKNGCPEVIFIYCAEGKGWCEIAGRRHEIGQKSIAGDQCRHAAWLWRGRENKPWTIHWFHAVGSNVPFYLERLGVTDQRPVVSLGGDVQLFPLFEEVREGLQHGFTLTHLILCGPFAGAFDGTDFAPQRGVLARRNQHPRAN